MNDVVGAHRSLSSLVGQNTCCKIHADEVKTDDHSMAQLNNAVIYCSPVNLKGGAYGAGWILGAVGSKSASAFLQKCRADIWLLSLF